MRRPTSPQIQKLLDRLESVRISGDGFTALCPAHNDHDPSLSVSEGHDGKVLLYCFAGCPPEAILRALGLTWSDLSPPVRGTGTSAPSKGRPARNGRTHPRGTIAATYDYTDSGGSLLYQAVRYEKPKRFALRRPNGRGGWLWSLNGVPRVLYRLPRVLAAVQQDAVIYLVEGEKDVHSLEQIGLVATTHAMGAGAWRDEYALPLREADVVILPDNDPAGRDHAEAVARSVRGVAKSVRLLPLPGLPEKGDVSDWLDNGGTREELERLVAVAREWKAPLTTVEELLAAVEQSRDAALVYDNAHLLASLNERQYAVVRNQLRDLLGRGLGLGRLDRAVAEERKRQGPAAAGDLDEDDGLPIVVAEDRPLRRISNEALSLLAAANDPPVLFVRMGKVVRVRADETGRAIIDDIGEPELRGRLTREANFISTKGHTDPSTHLVQDLLTLGEWPFPPLAGIVEVPTIRTDGSILEAPGYDAATGLYYVPEPGLAIPTIRKHPSEGDVEKALALIDEALGEFPYVDQTSKANALGLLLTPIVRPAISGCVPLALIDKPKAGTGASLLAEVVATVATGRPSAMMDAPKEDAEWRKVLTSVLLQGATVITIDNVATELRAASLARAITARVWQDRKLSTNETVRLPVRVTWMATGNNIRLGGDMPRRCYWIRLDAKTSRPWNRAGFRHPLPAWAEEHRGELIAALLAIVRAWFATGCPAADVPVLGSFEVWSRAIGGILAYAGVTGFLQNLEALYEQADDDDAQWEAFLAMWYTRLGTRQLTTAELVTVLRGDDAFRNTLPEALAGAYADEKRFPVQLGRALKQRLGTYYGNDGFHLEAGERDTHAKAPRWRVAVAGDET